MSENVPPFPLDEDDRFREVETTSAGAGWGVSWRPPYRTLDVWVAVKVPHLGPEVERLVVLKLFRNEVVAYAWLDHPNIVRALEANLDNVPPWYAMRWDCSRPTPRSIDSASIREPIKQTSLILTIPVFALERFGSLVEFVDQPPE